MRASPAVLVALGLGLLALGGCFGGPAPKTPAPPVLARLTDETGRVNLTVADRLVGFEILDATTGAPIPGLSVGVGLNGPGSQGVLMILDPHEFYPPRFVILEGAAVGNAAAAGAGALVRAQESETQDLLQVLLPQGAQTTLGRVFVEHLAPVAQRVDAALGLLDAAAAAANVLDQSGLPLGRFAEGIGAAETEYLTPEEATARLKQQFLDGLRDQLVSLTTTFEVPALLPTALDLTGQALSANAVLTCGLPGEKVAIRTAGPFQFVACENVGLGDARGLVRAAAEGVDEFGQPLSKGSLELFGRGRLGWGFLCPIDASGQALCEVPRDDYDLRFRSPGFGPTNMTGSFNQTGELGVQVRLEATPRLVLSLATDPFQTTLLDAQTTVRFTARVQRADGTSATCQPILFLALPYIGDPGTTIDAATGLLTVGPRTGSVKVVARCAGWSSPPRIVSSSGRTPTPVPAPTNATSPTPSPTAPILNGTWGGNWRETTQSSCQVGSGTWRATFQREGNALSGQQQGLDDWDGPIVGQASGNGLTWRLQNAGPGTGGDYVARATVEGATITGTFEDKCHVTVGGSSRVEEIRGTFEGQRVS